MDGSKYQEYDQQVSEAIIQGYRSQVRDSTFRVKDKEGIKDPESSLKMPI
jgi:hypothetical protein